MIDALDLLSLAALGVALLAFAGLIVLRRRGAGFTALTLIGLGAGIGIGLGFRGHVDYVGFLGDLYLQVLVAIVAPLLFVSVLSSVTSLGSIAKLRTIGLSSAFWLLLTNAIAIVLTLAVVLALGVGQGVSLDLEQSGGDTLSGLLKPIDEVILGLFPANLAGDVVGNNIVPIILFALLFAVAFIVANKHGDPQLAAVKNVIDGARKIVMAAVGFIIELTPYAVLALVAATTATAATRFETVLSLVAVLAVSFGITFFNAYVVNGVLLRVFADLNPLRFFRFLTPAQYTAFTTQSSVGTLPLTIGALTRKVGVPADVASFTAPIGTTIGMPGCAGIWPIIVAVFTINVLGIEYGIGDYLVLAGLCLLVSIGTAGVPGTAIITATAVLTAAGLPLEVLIVLIPINAIAGTASTMANVSAAATAAAIVARRRGTLDDAVFRADAGPSGGSGRRAAARSAAAATTGTTTAPTAVLDRPAAEPDAAEQAPRDQDAADAEAFDRLIADGVPVGYCEVPGTSTARTDETENAR
jgi:hypothetical protein